MGVQDRRCEYCIHYNTGGGYHCSLHIKSCAMFGCTAYQEKSFGPLDGILKSVREMLEEIIPMTINGRRIECYVVPDEMFPYDKDLLWIQVRLACPDAQVVIAFRQAINRLLTPEFTDHYLERIKRQIEGVFVKFVRDIIKNGKSANSGQALPKCIDREDLR